MIDRDSTGSNQFQASRRKSLRLSTDTLVHIGPPDGAATLPLLIQPAVSDFNLTAWAERNIDLISERLVTSGAILLRGFNVQSVDEFERFITVTCGNPLAYTERSSPRSRVSGNIYTSTDYPPDQSIFLHNEQSYNNTFPTRILFFCMKAAASGGETPIADTRKVLARISAPVRNKFIEDGYRYVRNFGNGLGLSWQTAFQTGDRRAVEDYCRRNDIEWEWKGGDRLRTSQVRPVLARHPVSSEPVWFNHATFFHVYTLDPMIRSRLLNDFGIEDFPNNTYYGDGSEIDPDIMCELRSAYEEEKVAFQWHEGDVLMLDNMLVAHGRGPYKGARKVVVGMSGSCSWSNVSLSQEGRR